ncbi:MAG: FeoB-associated Cys-rich membrane protein [Acetatifactor sp.]|nr:FeoB-associated Cys-rich membrane protein [Acetatifactor sp.]MDE7113717.1 FeoB-associated Cys-rich membrane protein [Acetatifactor sp.]MDE7271035.1 FeoB-associated Cys-rich membrane protein [Acetatifactor sp.]
MNVGTAVVLLILCGVVALIIRKMVQDKRNGKSLQCGMDCQHCGGHCAHKAE